MSGEALGSAAVPEAKPLPWRRRHPVRARALLYGTVAVVLGGGALWGRHLLEVTRQEGLMTRVVAAQQMYVGDPEGILRFVRTEVLDQDPAPDVRRQARLTVAACYVAASRWDDAERAYAEVSSEWPDDLPRGSLTVPWACMRVDAGRPREALALIDVPDATAGWSPTSQVGEIRARAQAAVDAPPAAPTEGR